MTRKDRREHAARRTQEFVLRLKAGTELVPTARRLRHECPQEASLIRAALAQVCRDKKMTEDQIKAVMDEAEPTRGIVREPAPVAPRPVAIVDTTMGLFERAGGEHESRRGPRRSRRPE